ncbi:MAG: nitroreductase/quinone reductase family protein [Chloroflexota bacterium]
MPEKYHDGLRKFNRTIFNPIIKLFAGRFLYSLVYHTGRRSGKEYATPVVAAKKDEFIFIPLPYGANTDWFLNVQAKGKCDVKIKGKLFSLTNPEIVDSTIALSAFPSMLQGALERAGIHQYLRLGIN